MFSPLLIGKTGDGHKTRGKKVDAGYEVEVGSLNSISAYVCRVDAVKDHDIKRKEILRDFYRKNHLYDNPTPLK